MTNKLPSLSHLQIAVLECLSTGDAKGKDLRDMLTKFRVRKSTPAFYQLMARMEQGGFVLGWYEQSTVGDHIVKERLYKITGNGRVALAETKQFYTNLDSEGAVGGLVYG